MQKTSQTDEIARLRKKLIREIRAREEAEQLLEKKSEELYLAAKNAKELARAMDTAADGIALTNSDGVFTYMNLAHAKMFGYTIDELMGRDWRILYDKSGLKIFEDSIFPDFQRWGFWQGDTAGVDKYGNSVYQNISLTALKGGGLVCATRDISERRRREQIISEMEARLKDAEQSAAVALVSDSIAHDLNNIVAAISGYAYLIQSELADNSHEFNLAKRISDAAHQAAQVVESHRSAANQGLCQLEQIEITELLHTNVMIAEGFRPEHVTIKLELNESFSVLNNEILLSRCILNILKNAFEAIVEEGSVSVCTLLPCDVSKQYHEDFIVFAGYPENGSIGVIEISDSGRGITPENLDKIFNPFFSTKQDTQLKGLGMQSLKALVDQGLAYIEVSSNANKGTRVRLHLQIPEHQPRDAADIKITQNGHHIIVVDDDELVGEMLLGILHKLGYSADWYSDPMLALTKIKESKLGLVITDLNMPQMNGDQLSKEIHQINPDVPIVIYSGQAAKIRPNPIYSAILQKPIDPKKLSEIIDKLMSN